MRSRDVVLLGLALAPALGCGRDRAGTASAAAPDSTLFGDDRAQGSGATVADVGLLERLIDEYERLDVVMDELAGPGRGGPLQGRAWKGDRHQDASKARLLDLLQAEFGERYHPRTPEGAGRTTDSIAALPGGAGARALTALVLRHHLRVARAIADGLPAVRNPRVRAVLAELQESLGKEIEKLGGPRASAAG